MILDGKKIAKDFEKKQISEIVKLKEKGINPNMTAIIVGDNPASKIYVNHKKKVCDKMEIDFNLFELDENILESELLSLIDKLNNDSTVHAILVQLPLPKQISEKKVIEKISPLKDVDGFNPINIGKLSLKTDGIIPCTPKGILEILKYYNIDLNKKNILVLGRSNIVGKPTVNLLLNEQATVFSVDEYSCKDTIIKLVKMADIVITATGYSDVIDPKEFKDNQVIIDIGIIRDENNKIRGDIDYKKVLELHKNIKITPVPGGVGPMTISMLVQNIIEITKKQEEAQYEF